MYVMVGGYLVHVQKPPPTLPSHQPNSTSQLWSGQTRLPIANGHSFLISISHISHSPAQHSTATTALPSFHLCYFYSSILFLQKEIFRFFFPSRKVIEGGYMPVLKEQGRPLVYICLDYFTYVRSVTQGPGAYSRMNLRMRMHEEG